MTNLIQFAKKGEVREMTDDLVKCLRNRANGIMQWVTVERMATEAADCIDQLEAALREKDNIAYVIDSHGMTHESFTIVYRAALEEKKDD